MTLRQALFSTVAAIGIAAMAVAVPAPAGAQQAVEIDNDDIGGVVAGPSLGPEAGVWVIAETTDLPTKFAIPPGLSIKAGGVILFYADNEPQLGPQLFPPRIWVDPRPRVSNYG